MEHPSLVKTMPSRWSFRQDTQEQEQLAREEAEQQMREEEEANSCDEFGAPTRHFACFATED